MSKNFLDRFKPQKNALQNLFQGPKAFSGQGQSLGGGSSSSTQKSGQVIPIQLTQPGTLGIRLQKSQTAIVATVVPKSQAESAGLKPGDILCFAGSNGQEEIPYDMFIALGKSSQRPVCLEARRPPARNQAVIAAAEKRELEHKKKQKPIPKDTTKRLLSNAEKARIEQERKERMELEKNKPLSEATKQAQELAKQSEQKTAQEFGYNPYESKSMNAGQARNAVTSSTHGSIASTDDDTTPKRVAAPIDPAAASLPEAVQGSFEAIVTSHMEVSKLISSLTIIKTLIANATTKGQAEDGAKFRKVRLSNAKIQAAVTNMPGAVDLMLECGFYLTTEEEESILLYPVQETPEWIPSLLHRIEQYIHNSK